MHLQFFVEEAILVETGFCFRTSKSPEKTPVSSTVLFSQSLTPNLWKLAARDNIALDLTLNLYSYKAVCTEIHYFCFEPPPLPKKGRQLTALKAPFTEADQIRQSIPLYGALGVNGRHPI